MAISELQKMKDELSRIRGGGVEHSPSNVMQTDLRKDEKDKNGGGDPLKGALYIGEQIGLGTLRSIEGISDFLVGGVADLFGADEFAEKMMLNDWVDYNHANEWYQPGEGMQFIGDVAQGVGGMLPAVAITLATAGAAAPVALAGQIGSTAAFMLGAAGQSTSEAVKESNNLSGKEWLYGTASGVAEGAIEAASGGLGGMKAGKVLGRQLGKNAIGKAAISFIGEGAEEVAADLLDPAIKKVTGLADTYEAPTAKELGRTFAVGGATGLAMGGLNTGIRTIAEGGVKKRKAVDAASELQEQQAEENVRQTEGEEALYTEEDIKASQERLSKPLQKMSKENREKFFEKHSTISNMFNEDGTVKDNSAPESYNTDAYSASLKGQEGTLAYKPVAKTSKVSDIAKKAMNTLAKMTRGKSNIVLTEDTLTAEDGSNANGLYRDGVIYLNANATSYDKALAVGVHEVIHGLEGTKEYGELSKYIIDAINGDPELSKKYDINKYRAAYDKLLQGEWSEGTKDYQASTEIFADFLANKVVDNEKLLNKLANRDKNIIQKFIDWVRDSIAKLGESAEDKAARKDLKKLEGLFVNALNAGAGGIALEDVEKSIRAAERAKLAKEAQKRNAETAETTEEKKNTVGKGKLATARAQIDVDNFDPIGYTEITLPTQERNRVQSEALKWSNKRNVPLKVSLANEYTYLCMLDENGEIHIFRKGKTGNIHERGNEYVNQNRKELDNVVEIVRTEQGVNAANNVTNRREARATDTSNNRQVRQEWERDGRGYRQDGVYADRTKERKGIVYYDSESDVKSTQKNLTEEQAEKRGIIDKKGGTVRYNLFTFEEGGGKQLLEKNLKKNGFTQSEIAETVKTMTDMAEYFRMLEADVAGLVDWNSAKVLYDAKTGKNVFTAMIKNGDYPLNIDLSTICKKRKALTKVLNTLVKRGYIDTVDLSSENIVKINEILKKYKYEVACPACFVETKRYRVDDWANKFLDPWNELIKNSVQNAQNLDFANGVYAVKGTQIDTEYLNRVIKEHTKVSENGKRSKDSVAKMATLILENESVRGYLNKADMIGSIGLEKMKQHQDKLYSLVLQRSGTATPKIIQEVQPYNSELSFQNQLAKKAEEVGGVRMFSFSDFTVLQTFDFLQVVADLASKRATMQSYTKEITFALLFGQTGIKINLSMIPAIDKTVSRENAGLNAKGEPIYSEQWGVNYNDAKGLMFKDGYNGNVGTATIGISKNHILKLLDDPVTNYIIPYHKSSINPTLAKMMDIDWYTDYTSVQNTRYSNGEKITAAEAKKFNFFKELAAAKDARKMAQNYLEWCKKNNYIPKFDEFAWHPNYYKLLVDFQVYKTVDGKEVYAPQNPVQMKFPDNFKEILKNELKNQEELDASRDVNFEKVMEETIDVLKKPTARASLDTELVKKTSDRVQTVVDDRKWHERWGDAYESLKNKIPDQWIKAQIAWTDEQAGILQAGKNVGVVLHGEVQRARTAKASAINMLNNEQRDYSGKKRVGDSLKDIFKPIQSRGKKVAQNFNLYLLHQLNVDRMSAVEAADRRIKVLFKANPMLEDAVNGQYEDAEQWRRTVRKESGGKEYLELVEVENKPVFEEKVDKAFSLEKIKELEKQYPEFKETAEKVWKYNQNLLQYRVDAGLITQEQADKMTEMYPHYVPAFYESKGSGTSGASVGNKGIAVKTGIKKAKGSKGSSDILDVQASIAKQTVAVVRAASINKVIEKLYDGAVAKKDFTDIEVVSKERIDNAEVDYDKEVPKKNQLFFYKDGERITLDTTEYVDAGFRGLTAGAQIDDPLTKLSEKAIDVFKKSVTSWNLLFAVTNTIRDAQEALFYTKYRKKSFVNYWKALFARRSSPKMKELWEQYKALGGTGSGYFNIDTGVYDDRSKVRRGVDWLGDKLQIVNDWVEQAPRFAEFVASVESGNSLEQALYDSAEVTTNFSRGGKITKKLNRCLIPFLNPSVQGWSKLWRSLVAPMDGKSAAEIERLSKKSKFRKILSNYGMLVFKSFLCGVTVGLLNDMLYSWFDDDEDYDNLPMNIKENYYLIKIDGKFIKIPKGRVLALYGSVFTRYVEYLEGNEDAFNAWDWFKSASEMVSPLESASRTIIAPFYDVWTNTTWYGGQIENASMENLAPSDRYDESTSSLAIAIGKSINYSPKKVHYLIDQYTGVIGDIVLPFTTNKAEKDPASARFIVDPVYNSDVANQYYDLKQELTFAKNSGDSNAKMMLKYINEAQGVVAEMYQQKRDIANDKNLKDKEKRDQTEVIQSLINATLSASIERADEFEQLLINSGFENAAAALIKSNSYQKMSETGRASAYNKLIDYYYAVVSSRLNNTMVDTKYVLYGAINATDVVVYLTDINNIESDTDKKGNVIQGSRKEKVQKYIQGLKLTAQQKYILSYLAGYAPTDNGKSAISKYLKKNGYTQKEVNNLWI